MGPRDASVGKWKWRWYLFYKFKGEMWVGEGNFK